MRSHLNRSDSMERSFIFTNDVEEFSIARNTLSDETAELVFKEGLPLLLDLYERHNIKATFYFTATFVEKFPRSVRIVKDKGHKIGCHGYSHDIYFNVLSLKEQEENLKKAKQIIEAEAGPIEDFRAPALRINDKTIRALEGCGFKTDSSVCPQRFDGPLTSAARNKLGWFFCPREPYYPSRRNPFKAGLSSVLEIPVSAAIFGYIGTVMRVSPFLWKLLRGLLVYERERTQRPLVFCTHPNEFINERGKLKAERRQANVVKYLFSDLLRRRLKLRNMGTAALNLLENEIKVIKGEGFKFTTMQEYREYHENIHRHDG